MRRLVLIFFAVVLAAWLAGCGGGVNKGAPVIYGQLHQHPIQYSYLVTLRGGPPPGSPGPGDVLTTSDGSWSGTPTGFTYLWQDCNSGTTTCSTAIGPPTNTNRYVIVSGDASGCPGGSSCVLRVQVTAAYSGHPSAVQFSASTAVVVAGGGGGSAPVNTVAPYFCGSTSPSVASNTDAIGGCSVLTGDAVSGQTLRTGTGVWTNSPSFSYQWYSCTTTAGQPPTTASCSSLGSSNGAQTSAYAVQAGDVGKSFVPIVTATNGSGSASTTVAGSSCNHGSTTSVPAGSQGQTYADPRIAAGCSPISAQVGSTTGTGAGAMRFCTNAPVTCGLGDPLSGNAGVPPGTTLTPGSIPDPCNGTFTGLYVTSDATINSGTCTIQNSRIVAFIHTIGDPGTGATIAFNHDDMSGPYTGQSTETTGTGRVANVSSQCSYTANAAQSGGDMTAVYSGFGQGTFHNLYAHCATETLQGPGSISDSYAISDECWGPCGGGSTTHDETIYTIGVMPVTYQNDFFAVAHDTSTGVVFNDQCRTVIDAESSLGLANVNSGNGAWWINNCSTDLSKKMQNTRVSRLYRSDATCGFAGQSSDMTWSGNIWDDDGTAISSC